MGGPGGDYVLTDNYPYYPEGPGTEYIQPYIILQLGNHLFSLIELMIFRRKDELKFYEFMLHHFLAVTLIIFSSKMNLLAHGILVLVIHDIADIILSFGRM
jgi:ceramide synthetase